LVVGRLLRPLDNLGRAAASLVEAAAAAVHVERVQGFCSTAAAAPPKGAAKTEKGARKEMKG